MSFYDNFFARRNITSIGKKIVSKEVSNRIQFIQRYCKVSTPTVLEIGPGRGYFAQQVKSLGWHYIGVDGSTAVVNLLQQEGIEIVQSFVPPLPEFPENFFDVALLEHVLEHMVSPADARDLLKDIFRVTKPDGIIIIVAPDYLSHRENFWHSDYTHAFVTTNERIKQLILDVGGSPIYTGYETLGIRGLVYTTFVTYLTRILFLTGIPQIMSLLLDRSFALSNKWKNVLFRSCIVIARK